MNSPKFVSGKLDVWLELKKLFRSKRRAYVAVAFLGSGASSRLELKAGDTLVVNAGETAVKRGLTDPRELRKFLKKGVSIYSHDQLHAKVFVCGNTVGRFG